MRRMIEGLLDRAMAPVDNGAGGGGGDDGKGGKAGGDDGAAAGAGAGAAGSGAGAGSNASGSGGDKGKPTVAEIAARAGGAFSRGGGKAGNGEGAGGDKAKDDDGVDPKTKPGAKAGDGRPDDVPEKFWDATAKAIKVGELAKSYKTLESNFAALKQEKGFPKDAGEKPDDYLPEGLVIPKEHPLDRIREFDGKNDPALEIFRKVAHEFKLPVSTAPAFALRFLEELNGKVEAPASPDDIVKELGANGSAMVDSLMTWMEGQYEAGQWSEPELEFAMQNFGSSAPGVRLLAKLREAAGEKPIPMGQPVGDGAWSQEEYYAAHADPRYKTDPAFRDKVEKMGERIFGTDPEKSSPVGVGIPSSRGFERRERAVTRS